MMKLGDFSLRRIKAVMIKEFRQLRRDKTTFAMMIMVPIMQLMLFGYAINSDPRNMPTVLFVQDSSPMARSIVTGLENTGYFKIEGTVSSEAEARRMLDQGRTQFVVTIPSDFGRKIIRGQRPDLLIEADATDPMAASGAFSAIGGMIDRLVSAEFEGPLSVLKGKPQPIQISVHRLYNPEGYSRYNIVPGLMGVVLTMTGVMMTALALTREYERGTMENLLSMPVHPIEVMAGKILPYVLIGYAQSFIIVCAARLLFNVPLIGSLWLLSVALIAFIICNLALGFTLSARAQNQMQAMQLSVMVLLPSILLSGFMFPFRGMPLWAQGLGSMLPATYFIRIVRGILLKGNGIAEIWPDLWPLIIFMMLITTLAMRLYREKLD